MNIALWSVDRRSDPGECATVTVAVYKKANRGWTLSFQRPFGSRSRDV